MIIVEIESILNSLVQVKQGMQVRKLDLAPYARRNAYFKKVASFFDLRLYRNCIFNRAPGENPRHHFV